MKISNLNLRKNEYSIILINSINDFLYEKVNYLYGTKKLKIYLLNYFIIWFLKYFIYKENEK